MSAVIYVLFFFFGKVAFRIFSDDPVLLDMALQGTRLYGVNFLFASLTMVIACYFMSIAATGQAVTINIFRTFVCNVIFIFLTPYVLGEGMVWAGIVFAEAAVAALTAALYGAWRKKEAAVFAQKKAETQ